MPYVERITTFVFSTRPVLMNRHYELKSATTGALRMLQHQLNKLSQMPVPWLEWDKEAIEAGLLPDISIINAIGMPTYDVIDAANTCNSPCVAVWGVRGSVAGLPALPMYFSAPDIYTITAGAVRSTPPQPIKKSNYFFTKVFGFSTIPSELSAR